MDLIEVLWKQDVDLGFSVENAAPKPEKPDVEIENATHSTDDIEKLKTLQAINKDKDVKEEPEEDPDPWAGLDYTIDTETGE
ncbi:unnamed protein product [Acanthoscelides obtectus]|uniref:Uncharacterized protein n=1 Tax=Acanthoscelides obtectus TaxID=200917 RepID=A0A9P0MIQ9_ACAOB|nr:unnamed protein product [Acanthoscelides obtectus]CAH2013724.1 unnamed protein product [Acanthoscelides obtectus]CAK1628718.1 Segmentation protein cap'n'collar [Acanthoscelides obtectus]CAK1688002.1 Segmentation protein cap'n'collar [Acanthoscelides obtectus]